MPEFVNTLGIPVNDIILLCEEHQPSEIGISTGNHKTWFLDSKLIVLYYSKNDINSARYNLYLEADIYVIIMKQNILWFSCFSLLRKLLIF